MEMNTQNLNFPTDPARLSALWHPEDVVHDARLSTNDKRALLAACASDERAVLGDPTLRQLPNGAVVSLASILNALRSLDGDKNASAQPTHRYPDHRHHRILTRWRRRFPWHRRRDDDDDEPPPAPVAVVARYAPAWF
jgi:hypothetical protein